VMLFRLSAIRFFNIGLRSRFVDAENGVRVVAHVEGKYKKFSSEVK
jgi:hypothetical protein